MFLVVFIEVDKGGCRTSKQLDQTSNNDSDLKVDIRTASSLGNPPESEQWDDSSELIKPTAVIATLIEKCIMCSKSVLCPISSLCVSCPCYFYSKHDGRWEINVKYRSTTTKYDGVRGFLSFSPRLYYPPIFVTFFLNRQYSRRNSE